MAGEIVVITGVGGMGSAAAPILAHGRSLALIDCDAAKLRNVAERLRLAGHDVECFEVDVADPSAVGQAAKAIAGLGTVRALLHTAGISGTMGTTERIFQVNLVGTAHVIDAFEPIMVPGGAAVCITSMGSIAVSLDAETESKLANAPTDDLLSIATGIRRFAPVEAYCVSKRANQLRVAAAAIRWGKRDLRINGISPGIISTPMAAAEADAVPQMAVMRRISPIQRIGRPEDIAQTADFLLGPHASFITGIDLPVDGGVIAASRYGGESAL